MKRRIFSMLLAIMVLFTSVDVSVFAREIQESEENVDVVQEIVTEEVNSEIYDVDGEDVLETEVIGKEKLGNNDYEIIGYQNNIQKGTAKVTLKGVGNYGGTKTVTFKIKSKLFSWWK